MNTKAQVKEKILFKWYKFTFAVCRKKCQFYQFQWVTLSLLIMSIISHLSLKLPFELFPRFKRNNFQIVLIPSLTLLYVPSVHKIDSKI